MFYYNGNLNYQTFNDFLQQGSSGNAFALLANGPAVTPFTEIDAAGYVQDDWKVTPSFTAHLGLRWEFFSQAVNLLHSETVARQSNPATAFWDQSLPLSATTDPAVSNFYEGFQPRIGFAYNPQFDKNLVVRGGYAINENPAYYNLITLASDAAPVVNFGAIGCDPSDPCIPSNGSLLGSDVRTTNLPALPTGGDPRSGFEQYFPTNFRPPYVQTYTLAVEHQLGKAAVGEAATSAQSPPMIFSRLTTILFWQTSLLPSPITSPRTRFARTPPPMGSGDRIVITTTSPSSPTELGLTTTVCCLT